MFDNPTMLFDALAVVTDYPDGDFFDAVDTCELVAATGDDAMVTSWLAFRDEARTMSLIDLQELYVRTFEMSTSCTLEVGFHVFGEGYKRGEFLAHLRAEEEPFDIGQQKQLPDYLPVLLRLITRIADAELRRDLLGACVIPAVGMINTALAEKEGPYRHIVDTIAHALETYLKSELAAVDSATPVDPVDLIAEPDHA